MSESSIGKQHIVLGINDEHDAGCALVIDGQLVAAYEEERFSRKKMHNGQNEGLPQNSFKQILSDFHISPNDISLVTYNFPKSLYLMKQVYSKLLESRCGDWWLSGFKTKDFHGVGDYIYPMFYVTRKRYKLDRFLRKNGINPKVVRQVDHHVSHAASAYYTSGLQNALVLTLDGHGSGVSGSISVGEGPVLHRKKTISKYDSVGLLYSTITAGLGFKAGRHEGKVLGLAAFGDSDVFYEKIKPLISCNGLSIDLNMMRKYPSPIYPHFLSLRKTFEKEFMPWSEGHREHLAAALQRRVEEVICQWAQNAVKEFGVSDIVVAGGVFANVKVNQRITEIPEVTSLHVYPAMSDSGLAAGSALYEYYKEVRPTENHTSFTHNYLGQGFQNSDIVESLERCQLPYKKFSNIEKEVATLLNNGSVVARFNGPGEYGPRALGNRSVLYNGRDKSVNDWLNRKLDRTEFMPFAPVTLEEDASEYYIGIDEKGRRRPAQFMTITFECMKRMLTDCPAAVHIDNTARPQLVSKKINPSFHKIISEYKKLSGSSTIVNTSFNVHEEPIVNSPKDAIRSFLFTRLDALAIGDYLILKKDL